MPPWPGRLPISWAWPPSFAAAPACAEEEELLEEHPDDVIEIKKVDESVTEEPYSKDGQEDEWGHQEEKKSGKKKQPERMYPTGAEAERSSSSGKRMEALEERYRRDVEKHGGAQAKAAVQDKSRRS